MSVEGYMDEMQLEMRLGAGEKCETMRQGTGA